MLIRLACLLVLTMMFVPPASSQSQNEYSVRAALVLNLTKYVEWPQMNKELTIAFVGDGPMGETLKTMLAGRSNGVLPVRVLLSPSDEELERCNIIYIGHTSSKRVHAALGRAGARSTLTVGETDSFTREGGMVSLVRVGEQVQIQINLDAAQAAGLKISSRLLNLPSVVRITGKH
jgi:hypothetical protein